MEAARDLVAALLELRPGVQDRVDHLEGVDSALVPADGDTAAVILDGDHAVGRDLDRDSGRVAGHRLVDRVVDDLPDQVMEPAGIGRADIHAWPLSNSREALEDLDAFGVVIRTAPGAGLGPGAALGRRPGRAGCGGGAHLVAGILGHAGPPVRRSYSRPRSSSV